MKKIIANLIFNLFSIFRKKEKIGIFFSKSSYLYENLDCISEKIPKEQIQKIFESDSSLGILWQLARVKVLLIDQSDWFVTNLSAIQKIKIVQCWHSSGLLKKVGFDAQRKGFPVKDEYERIQRIHGKTSYFIVSDKKLILNYSKAFHLETNQILPFGLARTDKFFKENISENKMSFLKGNNIERNRKKILLYAPTFCNRRGKRTHFIDLDIRNLQKNLGNDWVFLFKSHPTVEIEVPDGWIDVSRYKNSFLLSIADILVSDYSSIIFDFSYFRRPIVLMSTRETEYINNERGLYLSQEDLVYKSNVCKSTDELIQKIKKGYLKKSDIWERFMSACDGHSSKRIAYFVQNLAAN